MLLVMDVGNSNTVLGLFHGKELVHTWRITTTLHRTADEYSLYVRTLFFHHRLDVAAVEHVAVASVVPPIQPVLEAMLERTFDCKPLWVEPGVKTGLKIRYENPAEVGADRIVNAVAALQMYGGPAIIVDFGTATTLDAVTEKGEYLGGSISPGIGISAEALFARAARLPRVEVRRPEAVIGRTTVMAMQSGLYFGYIGQVNHLLALMKEELGGDPKVILTGGFAPSLAADLPAGAIVAEHLTLHGLRLIHERNTDPASRTIFPGGLHVRQTPGPDGG